MNISRTTLRVGFVCCALLLLHGLTSAQTTQNEAACYNMVQGKVAWNASGNTQWQDDNVRALCKGTTDPTFTVSCFQQRRAATNDWAAALKTCVAKPFAPNNPQPPAKVPLPAAPSASSRLGSSLTGGKDLVALQGPYLLSDIAIGSSGGVWAIGQKKAPGGYSPIKEYKNGGWRDIDGAAMQITVDDFGRPWIVNESGIIYFRHSNKWNPYPSPPAVNLIFRNDQMWMLGKDGYARRWDNTARPSGEWADAAFVGKGAKSLTHVTSGYVLAVTDAGKIYRRGPSRWWTTFNGKASDIAASKAQVWIIDETGALSIQTPTGWERRYAGPFLSLAVDTQGQPWASTASGLLMMPPH